MGRTFSRHRESEVPGEGYGPDPGVQGLGGRVPKVVPLIAGQKGFKTHLLSAPESKRAWRGGPYTLQAPGEWGVLAQSHGP